MSDFSDLVVLAQELISDNGEQTILRKRDQRPDPDRPWDVTLHDTVIDYQVSGVFFPNQGIRNPHTRQRRTMGSEVMAASLTGYLAAGDLPDGVRVDATDLVIRASGEEWSIHAVDDLNPNGQIIFFEVRLQK